MLAVLQASGATKPRGEAFESASRVWPPRVPFDGIQRHILNSWFPAAVNSIGQQRLPKDDMTPWFKYTLTRFKVQFRRAQFLIFP